jgi:endonuclease/exonuclease/phosphatase family metal-dependent hydrolase
MPSLTVATFNVRYGTAADGPNAWEHRRPLVGETVRGFAADVIGFQEVQPVQVDYFAQVLPHHRWVGVSREDGRVSGGEMVPIFWDNGRLELIDAGHFWLSQDPHLPGSKGWGTSLPRMATWAALRFRHPPRVVYTVVNTHFDYKGADARPESARLFRRRVAALGPAMPVILTGDFNDTPGSPTYQLLLADRLEPGDGLVDVFRAARPTPDPDEGTFHDFTGRSDGRRIDWVLASRHWRVAGARIDDTCRGSIYPSDHFPVVAELAIAGGG